MPQSYAFMLEIKTLNNLRYDPQFVEAISTNNTRPRVVKWVSAAWLELVTLLVSASCKRWKNSNHKKSPPAWTQEVYRPPLIKCSLCCSFPGGGWGGGGIPAWSGWGYPPVLTWLGGVPQPDLAGGGVPQPDLAGGYTPVLTYSGVLQPDLGGGGIPGYPPCRPDLSKQYFPHPSDAAVIWKFFSRFQGCV